MCAREPTTTKVFRPLGSSGPKIQIGDAGGIFRAVNPFRARNGVSGIAGTPVLSQATTSVGPLAPNWGVQGPDLLCPEVETLGTFRQRRVIQPQANCEFGRSTEDMDTTHPDPLRRRRAPTARKTKRAPWTPCQNCQKTPGHLAARRLLDRGPDAMRRRRASERRWTPCEKQDRWGLGDGAAQRSPKESAPPRWGGGLRVRTSPPRNVSLLRFDLPNTVKPSHCGAEALCLLALAVGGTIPTNPTRRRRTWVRFLLS